MNAPHSIDLLLLSFFVGNSIYICVLSRRLPYPLTHVRTHAYTNIRPDDRNKAAMNARKKNLIWKMKSGIYTKHSANMNGRQRERERQWKREREPKRKQTSEVKELTRTRECSPPT